MVAVGGDLDKVGQPGDGVPLELEYVVNIALAPALEKAADAVAAQSSARERVLFADDLLAVVYLVGRGACSSL